MQGINDLDENSDFLRHHHKIKCKLIMVKLGVKHVEVSEVFFWGWINVAFPF